MQFMMPEHALPADAEVAVLLGLHQKIGGPYKLVYLFRRLRCVHVYECLTQGREWWFSLHLTTDTRYCLRELKVDSSNRRVCSFPPCCVVVMFLKKNCLYNGIIFVFRCLFIYYPVSTP